MKKILLLTLMLVSCFSFANAQAPTAVKANAKQAEIKFDQTIHNFGAFSGKDPKVSCVFTFTNAGDAPLIINQAVPSCGCTIASYPKEPIMPGKKGEIKVSYDGTNKFPGHFKKSITVRTNGVTEMTRLYIEGDMSAAQ